MMDMAGSLDPDVGVDSAEFQHDPVAIHRNVIPYRIHSRYKRFIKFVYWHGCSEGTLVCNIDSVGIQKPQIPSLFV